MARFEARRYPVRPSVRTQFSVVSPGDPNILPPMAATSFASFRRLFDEVGTVDAVGVEERVAKFAARSIKKRTKLFGLKLAVSMVDLTTLEGKDTPGKVAALCVKAQHPHDDAEVPCVAAVCIYPAMVRYARRALGPVSPIRIASVATAFPSGQTPL